MLSSLAVLSSRCTKIRSLVHLSNNMVGFFCPIWGKLNSLGFRVFMTCTVLGILPLTVSGNLPAREVSDRISALYSKAWSESDAAVHLSGIWTKDCSEWEIESVCAGVGSTAAEFSQMKEGGKVRPCKMLTTWIARKTEACSNESPHKYVQTWHIGSPVYLFRMTISFFLGGSQYSHYPRTPQS